MVRMVRWVRVWVFQRFGLDNVRFGQDKTKEKLHEGWCCCGGLYQLEDLTGPIN